MQGHDRRRVNGGKSRTKQIRGRSRRHRQPGALTLNSNKGDDQEEEREEGEMELSGGRSRKGKRHERREGIGKTKWNKPRRKEARCSPRVLTRPARSAVLSTLIFYCFAWTSCVLCLVLTSPKSVCHTVLLRVQGLPRWAHHSEGPKAQGGDSTVGLTFVLRPFSSSSASGGGLAFFVELSRGPRT